MLKRFLCNLHCVYRSWLPAKAYTKSGMPDLSDGILSFRTRMLSRTVSTFLFDEISVNLNFLVPSQMSLHRKRMTLHLRLPQKIWGHLLQDTDAMLILIEDRVVVPLAEGPTMVSLGHPGEIWTKFCASRLVRPLSFFKLY